MQRQCHGSAMAETIVTLGFTLTLIMGTIQIVFLGYYQMQLDAATFLNSYEFARTNVEQTAGLNAALPEQPAMTITTNPSPPPSTEPNDPNALAVMNEYTTQGYVGGATDPVAFRYGGASILRPQQVSTTGTLDLPSLNLSTCTGTPPKFGFCVPFAPSFTLSSGNIEGRTMVANHDDDGGGYGYNTATVGGNGGAAGLVNPIAIGGDDQDVPPYYFNMAYMALCQHVSGGNQQYDCNTTAYGGNVEIDALGLAEFLQDSSYAGAFNGNYNLAIDGIGPGDVFGAMRCHQNVYAAIATDLAGPLDASYTTAVLPANRTILFNQVGVLYQWDRTNAQGFSGGGTLGYGAGSAPTAPLKNC